MLDNKTIYRKTLVFSLRRLLWDLLSIAVFAAICGAGFLLADKLSDNGLIGLLIGAVAGLIVLVIVMRFLSYRYKAGQIAMMTRGITEGELPNDVLGEGRRVVKERFVTVAAFFAATKVISGIFDQLGRLITKAGEAIGGDTGSAVGSAVSAVISTIVRYLCDCCLGWVFYRKDVKSMRATCEGAVLFFRHGKTFAKNMGRVFGIGLASLLVIGGVFGAGAYLIFAQFPQTFVRISQEFVEMAAKNPDIPAFLTNPSTAMIAAAALVGAAFWAILHSVFIRPFVLVGVLRNYINSGMNDIPDEESFRLLDGKSKKFRTAHAEI
ncbi:MAG: hypothetical protein IJK86_05070 [Lachnospiraceae bacterium]|nr:hypothetical protein [Lachnospiraceae bacterium]